jgi:hypothetical protein
MDTPERIMRSGYGSRLALPVWVETMKTADRLKRFDFGSLKSPVPMESCRLCDLSGLRVTNGCERSGHAYNAHIPSDLAPAPNEVCTAHPPQALPVTPEDLRNSSSGTPPRAIPVRPPRAIPVE